jgi:hypothetical protein
VLTTCQGPNASCKVVCSVLIGDIRKVRIGRRDWRSISACVGTVSGTYGDKLPCDSSSSPQSAKF